MYTLSVVKKTLEQSNIYFKIRMFFIFFFKIAIPLAIAPDRLPATNKFFIIADVLTALHFTSDPYVYVLSRSKSINWSLLGCIKRWRSGWRPGGLRRSQSDQSRMRTTMTEANTLEFN